VSCEVTQLKGHFFDGYFLGILFKYLINLKFLTVIIFNDGVAECMCCMRSPKKQVTVDVVFDRFARMVASIATIVGKIARGIVGVKRIRGSVFQRQ
jgi:hypothetical protein